MGRAVGVYSEVRRKFFRIAAKAPIDLRERRRLLGTPLRYCIGGDYVYLPADDNDLPPLAQLCWAIISSEVVDNFDFHLDVGVQLPEYCTLNLLQEGGVSIGDRYLKRQREINGRLQPVNEFCAQSLLDAVSANPEVLDSLTKTQFEEFCAEIFAQRGFKVDLFRATKDEGIDFLSVDDNSNDPIVFAVQCKHPDSPENEKKPNVLRVPVVREIYGVAKAFDFQGGIAISSTTYTSAAKKFTELKPSEIKVHNREDLVEWLSVLRWNKDELP